jgi:undecaprenyl-diphosphatase
MATNARLRSPSFAGLSLLTAALALTAAIAFLVLASVAAAYDTAPGDVWTARQLQSVEIVAFQTALDITEDAAQFPLYLAVLAIGFGLILAYGGIRPAALLLAVPILTLLSPALKAIIARPRPDAALIDVVLPQPGSMSFPSGHAFTAALVYGLIFCLATAYIPVRWLRLAIQAACAWIIVVTCIERVYVGHHWPSDVAGGVILGALIVAALLAIDRAARSRVPDAALASATTRG